MAQRFIAGNSKTISEKFPKDRYPVSANIESKARNVSIYGSRTLKSYSPDPSNPSLSTGTAEYKLMIGGRYVVEHFKGEFGGEEFEGVGVTGFDKTKNKYVGFWFDNMGTGFMQTEGTYDEQSRTMTQTGSAGTPLGTMKMKMVSKEIDENTATFTMYMLTPDGGEMKNMEITYKRK